VQRIEDKLKEEKSEAKENFKKLMKESMRSKGLLKTNEDLEITLK